MHAYFAEKSSFCAANLREPVFMCDSRLESHTYRLQSMSPGIHPGDPGLAPALKVY
jgi:hypothetical protein